MEDNTKEFNKLFDKIEPMPDALSMSTSDVERLTVSCYYSIAISLKRIADVMTAPPPVLADIPEELREEWEKANAAMVGQPFVEFKR